MNLLLNAHTSIIDQLLLIFLIVQRRIQSSRYDCFPCIVSETHRYKLQEAQEQRENKNKDNATEVECDLDEQKEDKIDNAGKPASSSPPVAYTGSLRVFLTKYVTPVMVNPRSALAVVILFMILTGLFAYFASSVSTDDNFADLFPPDSVVSRGIRASTRFFGHTMATGYFVFQSEDWTHPLVRNRVSQLIVSTPISCLHLKDSVVWGLVKGTFSTVILFSPNSYLLANTCCVTSPPPPLVSRVSPEKKESFQTPS